MQTESLEEVRELFRQAGVDIGGRHLFALSIATNGPVTHITALDINDDVWLWKDSDPEKWMKLPRVPFLEPVVDAPSKPVVVASEPTHFTAERPTSEPGVVK